jgi:outer membrane lipoprotein SlyB
LSFTFVGSLLGDLVGDFVGILVGCFDGALLKMCMQDSDQIKVVTRDQNKEIETDSHTFVGSLLGDLVGDFVGFLVVGCVDGDLSNLPHKFQDNW